MKLGIIGLGKMGSNLALQAVEKGVSVVGKARSLKPEPQPREPFPTTLILASVITVAVVGVVMLVYFKKRKR